MVFGEKGVSLKLFWQRMDALGAQAFESPFTVYFIA
jgi:hypothetical protein